jgi:release factor glutamine methyltransferase
MLLKEFYSNFLKELKPFYEPGEAAAIAAMLFEALAGISRSTLIKDPAIVLSMDTAQQLTAALQQLKQHTPVQYIIGHAWFYNLVFKVSPAVLVPRPETEELVKAVLDFLKNKGPARVLDIGTGSGCIPITIKNQLPQTIVSALDISEAALLIAKENTATHQTDIHWYALNFLEENNWESLGMYDVIISNPPYIPENEKEKLQQNVTAHEPHLALFVPDNQPLIFYERIALFGQKHLAPEGAVFLETHEFYAQAVANHFTQQGYTCEIQKDFYEKERMVWATRRR